MDLRRGEHVALLLPPDASGGSPALSRRSWSRHWRQCTRLQRSLILMCVALLFAALLMTILKAEVWWPSLIAPPSQPQSPDALLDPANSDPGKLLNPAEQLDQPLALGHIQIAPIRMQNLPGMAAEVAAEAAAARAAAADHPGLGDGVGAAPPAQPPAQPLPHQILSNQLDEPGLAAGGEGQPDAKRAAAMRVADTADAANGGDALLEGPKDFKGPANERQRAVVAAFRHAWTGYKQFAWGHDNLKPISMASHDWFGLGLTIVDSLDTMYIMDLQEDFDEARDWIDQHLHFDVSRDINLFEVTIRVLGGLLSAYHLSGDKMFLAKANDLGTRLMPCFDSPSGIPFSDINLATMNAHSPKWSPDSSTSEVTTIQLEFRDLARATGNERYATVVERINGLVHGLQKLDGLVPIFINANTGTFRAFATVSLGARGDSYYEYLLKQWLQSGKRQDEFLIDDYRTAIDGVLQHLRRATPKEQHVYIGELINGKDFKPKMDHLTCYLPGTLLLGHQHAAQPAAHRQLADELLETCYQTYMRQPTQLAPEITYFSVGGESEADMYVKSNDAHNLLRPEFIESLYYFYALTGNATYQEMGWRVFEAFERHTKVRGGYTSIGNVKNVLNTRPKDMMESFFLGETLKYFYLLFSDDRREVDLEKFVFNSEAHLVPIWA